MSPIELYIIECELSPFWGRFFRVLGGKNCFFLNLKLILFQYGRYNIVKKKICTRKNEKTFHKSCSYSDVSIKNINILPNRQYIANTANLAQEQYS